MFVLFYLANALLSFRFQHYILLCGGDSWHHILSMVLQFLIFLDNFFLSSFWFILFLSSLYYFTCSVKWRLFSKICSIYGVKYMKIEIEFRMLGATRKSFHYYFFRSFVSHILWRSEMSHRKFKLGITLVCIYR